MFYLVDELSCSWALNSALMAMKNTVADERIIFVHTFDNGPEATVSIKASGLARWAKSKSAASVSIHEKDGTGCGMFYLVDELSALVLPKSNPYLKLYGGDAQPTTLYLFDKNNQPLGKVVLGTNLKLFSDSLLRLRGLDSTTMGAWWVDGVENDHELVKLGSEPPPLKPSTVGVVLQEIPNIVALANAVKGLTIHGHDVVANAAVHTENEDCLHMHTLGLVYPLILDHEPASPEVAWVEQEGVADAVKKFCTGAGHSSASVTDCTRLAWFMFLFMVNRHLLSRDLKTRPTTNKKNQQALDSFNAWLHDHGVPHALPNVYNSWWIYAVCPTMLLDHYKNAELGYISVTSAYKSTAISRAVEVGVGRKTQ